MTSLVLYTWPMSRGVTVQYMLEEIGAPCEMRLLNLQKGDHRRPEYAAVNPLGKVPALVVGDVVITEVAAIIAWLADAFPAAGLAPAIDAPERGTYLRWLFFCPGALEPAMLDAGFNRTPISRSISGYGTKEDMLRVLSEALARGPWLLGERFSAADVLLGSYLDWGLSMNMIEATPEIAAYVERLHARPAYQRHLAENKRIMAEAAAA